MRSAASANGLGVSGSSCLLQIALIAENDIISTCAAILSANSFQKQCENCIHHLLSKQREWTRSHLHQTDSALDAFVVRTGPLTHVWVLSGLMESF